MFDDWPCLDTDNEAWQYFEDHWRRVDSSDVAMNAAVMTKAKYDQMFGQLPALPRIAFQEAGNTTEP